MPRNFTDKSIWNMAPGFGLNNVNVPSVGEVNSLFQNAGLPALPQYGSQDDLGKRIILTEAEAVGGYYTYAAGLAATTSLYGGMYQLVLVSAAATAANIFQGAAAYLLDAGAQTYTVTDSAHADSSSLFAGVFLMAATPGNYTVIQVDGKATVKCTAAVAVGAAGSLLVSGGASAGTFDTIANATALNGANAINIMGRFIQAPANGALKTAKLFGPFARY